MVATKGRKCKDCSAQCQELRRQNQSVALGSCLTHLWLEGSLLTLTCVCLVSVPIFSLSSELNLCARDSGLLGSHDKDSEVILRMKHGEKKKKE